jgi:hypothetical protein
VPTVPDRTTGGGEVRITVALLTTTKNIKSIVKSTRSASNAIHGVIEYLVIIANIDESAKKILRVLSGQRAQQTMLFIES